MSKKRVVVVCPGRGSYTKESLGYLTGRRSVELDLQDGDKQRAELGFPGVLEMDQMDKFKTSLHTKGEHASPLIYLCAKADFLDINRDKYDIVAIAGNSMGWYLTMAFAEALSPHDSFHLIQTMGAMMKDGLIGGQVIYPVINENWQFDHDKNQMIENLCTEINNTADKQVYLSIRLGGYRVLAGNTSGVKELLAKLPKEDPYPFQLVNHGAFHTPLLKEVSQKAEHSLYKLQLGAPKLPMIDGRGHIWQPYSTDIDELYDYTLGHQVVEPYDFTQSMTVALKEFNPDHLILLGPGNSLGGAIGQTLIAENWQGITDKSSFIERQKSDPFLLSMGVPEQKSLITK